MGLSPYGLLAEYEQEEGIYITDVSVGERVVERWDVLECDAAIKRRLVAPSFVKTERYASGADRLEIKH
jgi:hypothetical protein